MTDAAQFDRRRDALLAKLPGRIGDAARWLLLPERRWIRIPAGLLLTLGGVLSFLPLLGLWMLPLGLILLAEDVPICRHLVGKMLGYLARKRPDWFGEA